MLIFLITDVNMIENLAMLGNFVVTEKFVYFLLSLTKKDHSSTYRTDPYRTQNNKKKGDLPKIDSV